MTTIKKVTNKEMNTKFSNLAQQILGTKLDNSHVAVVKEREPSNIYSIEGINFLKMLEEKGFSVPSQQKINVVREREPSKIYSDNFSNFMNILKEKGFEIPKNESDIVIVRAIQSAVATGVKKPKM